MFKLEFSGVDEALEKLRALGREAADEHAMSADGIEALQPVVEDAQRLAPVEEGDLRDSIEAVEFDDGSVGVVIGDFKGHFFEFGTVKMRAQPMLIPAFEANEAVVVDILGGRVGARIEKSV